MTNVIPMHVAISRQVWVCDTCGCRDNKSCNCDSVAHAEEIAAKKEIERQRVRAAVSESRMKSKARNKLPPIENIQESMPTAEEAEESYQETLYDQACLFLESMTGETRRRFFAHIKEKYDVS